MKKVIIIGGGVAGMSAAHELAERGFKVEVYENKHKYAGGKARSVDVPGSSKDGKTPLPGEHGFRFFPGFYKHITDTMKRIPYGNDKSVHDNLVPTETITLGRYGKQPIQMLAHFPRNVGESEFLVKHLLGADTGLTKEEEKFFGTRVWQLMTSCKERRANEYEGLGWWEFLQADRFSDAYKTLLVEGLTRTLVAAKAKTASTKTGGDIFLQLIFNTLNPFVNTDRVLNGPTNQVWIDPWFSYLTEKLGVIYNFGSTAKQVKMAGDKIDHVVVRQHNQGDIVVRGDYYVFAVPVERMAALVNDDMLKADSTLQDIIDLAPSVNWMNGLQVYLNEDVKISRGHVICSDSAWAVTCISQPQFWSGTDLSTFGNGKVKGIISIDISDWFSPGFNGKAASDCTKEEIYEEVWLQLKDSLNFNGNEILKDDMVVEWFLDSDIVSPAKPYQQVQSSGIKNMDFDTEPLLVNRVNTWALRPQAYTNITNLFLASDYVKTNTDLATMEGANEAARRAVNAIIQSSGADQNLCKLWDLHEPVLLAPFRWEDEKKYKKGLPWDDRKGSINLLFISLLHYSLKIISLFGKRPSKVKQ